MEKKIFFAGLFLGCLMGSKVSARIDADSFDQKITLTAGHLFLNQVDTVALYLSTQNIVYVPRLTEEKKVVVEMTFLGALSNAAQVDLKRLSLRHIRAFNKTLKERLEFYIPEIAKKFDSKTEVTFQIQTGAQKETLARWEEGEWIWVKTVLTAPQSASGKPATQILKEEAFQFPAEDQKKKCPALITVKKEKVTVVEDSTKKEFKKESKEELKAKLPSKEEKEESNKEERPNQGQQNKI